MHDSFQFRTLDILVLTWNDLCYEFLEETFFL